MPADAKRAWHNSGPPGAAPAPAQGTLRIGIKVDFEVAEWNTLIDLWRAGAKSGLAKGGNSINFTCFIQDPFTAFIRHPDSKLVAPNGTDWG